MIRSRLRRRGPQRIVPQVVPVIQEKLDWAFRPERTLGTVSKKAILQNGTRNDILDSVGAAGVACLPLKHRAPAGSSCTSSSRKPRALF
jgi:hypothetical protein